MQMDQFCLIKIQIATQQVQLQIFFFHQQNLCLDIVYCLKFCLKQLLIYIQIKLSDKSKQKRLFTKNILFIILSLIFNKHIHKIFFLTKKQDLIMIFTLMCRKIKKSSLFIYSFSINIILLRYLLTFNQLYKQQNYQIYEIKFIQYQSTVKHSNPKMNSQNSFKIQFQLTKKGSEIKQAALIIQSFDFLSWLDEDCKIGVISQNKIQVLIDQNNNKQIELSEQLKRLNCKYFLLEKIKQQSDFNVGNGFMKYQQKAQREQFLIKQIFKKIQEKKLNFQITYNKTYKERIQNIVDKTYLLKYRKFKIETQFTLQNKQKKYSQFYLIQKGKQNYKKKYYQNIIGLHTFIQYVLVEVNSINTSILYNFHVQISTRQWVNQDIKKAVKKYYINKQNIQSIGRKIFKQKKQQIKNLVLNQSTQSIFEKMQVPLKKYVDLYMERQLNRNVAEYLSQKTKQDIYYWKIYYDGNRDEKNTKKSTKNIQNKFQKMEEIRQVQMKQIYDNLFINQPNNQELKQLINNSIDKLMRQLVNYLINKNIQIIQNSNSQNVNTKVNSQMQQKVVSKMSDIVKKIIISMIKNIMIQWIQQMINQKIKQLFSEQINDIITKKIPKQCLTDTQGKDKMQGLIKKCKTKKIKNLIDHQQKKEQLIKWMEEYMIRLIQDYRSQFLNVYITDKHFRKQMNESIIKFLTESTTFQINQNKILNIQVFNFKQFANKYFKFLNKVKKGPIAFDIDDYMRKIFIQQNKSLKNNQFQYPYIQPHEKKCKNMFSGEIKKYYTLAFQGGGAKGVAYVGVYKALLQASAQIPIKSIIGSSAGGIFALAVSTKITSAGLEKLCYPMSSISKDDRIIIQRNQQNDDKEKIILDSIKFLLSQHGILQQNLFDHFYEQWSQSLMQKLRIFLESADDSLGNIIGPTYYGDKFNFRGILMEGAFMKGQAIEEVASQCLAKYMIKHFYQRDISLKNAFSSRKWLLIQNAIQQHNSNYQGMKNLTFDDLLHQNNLQMSELTKKKLIITIINKCLLYLSELIKDQQYLKGLQMQDKEFRLNSFNFKALFQIFDLNLINKNEESLYDQVVYDILSGIQKQIQQDVQLLLTRQINPNQNTIIHFSTLSSVIFNNQIINDQMINLEGDNNNEYQELFNHQLYQLKNPEDKYQPFKIFHKYFIKQLYDAYFYRLKKSPIQKSPTLHKIQNQSQLNILRKATAQIQKILKYNKKYIDYQKIQTAIQPQRKIKHNQYLKQSLKIKLESLLQILKERVKQFQRIQQPLLKEHVLSRQKQNFKRLLKQVQQEFSQILKYQNKKSFKSNIQTLRNFQSFFGKPFILNPSYFRFKTNISFNGTIHNLLMSISTKFNNYHWNAMADIITDSVEYFSREKNQQRFKQYINIPTKKKDFLDKAKQFLFCSKPQKQSYRQKFQPFIINIKIVEKKINDYEYLKNIMKIITLEEYYQLNQVQLTLTSVDLNMATLRFFNHKTTPGLPVCKVVQMTGSFPVGFKAQQWKKQWGNYFVHFDDIRRQIDLTSNQFTDGGMLANFPIKYLDNQIMRPKYFSHFKNKGCEFFGFGLDQLAPENYYQSSQQQKNSQDKKHKFQIALQDLINQLKDKILTANNFFKIICRPSQKKVKIEKQFPIKVQQNLDKIPLLRFLIKFIAAYPNADRNLNVQCFTQKIIIQNKQQLQDQIYIPDKQNNHREQTIQKKEYRSIYNQPSIFNNFDLSQNMKYLEGLLGLRDKQTNQQHFHDEKKFQNIILDQQVFIRYQFNKVQDNIDISIHQNFINQFKQQYCRKLKSYQFRPIGEKKKIQQDCNQNKSRFAADLKLIILKAMMEHVKSQFNEKQIYLLTIQFMLIHGKYMSTQLLGQKIKIEDKLLQLAKYKFQKMFNRKQFKEIQMLGCFQNYKQFFYEDLLDDDNYEQQAKQEGFDKLSEFSIKQLEQFINIEDSLITKNQKNFTIFVFSKIIYVQNKQIWFDQMQKSNPTDLIQNYDSKLSVQKIMQVWNIFIFKQNKSYLNLTQENIIKNYFEWNLAEKLFISLKNDPDNFFQIFRRILTKKQNKYNQKVDNDLRQKLKQLRQKKLHIKQYQSVEKQELYRKEQQKTINLIINSYKNKIFSIGKNNFISQLLRKLNDQNYQRFLVQKSLKVINIFQILRVSKLIQQVMNQKQCIDFNPRAIQLQLKSKLKQILILNSSLFYHQIKNIQFAANKINQKKQIQIILQQFYFYCVQKIYQYYRNKNNHNNLQIIQNIRQQTVVETIIILQQDILISKIKNQKLEQLIQQDIKSSNSIFRFNLNIVKYMCLSNSFQIFLYQKGSQKLEKILKNKIQQKKNRFKNISKCKESQKNKVKYQLNQAIKISKKYHKCKYDYQLINKFLSQISLGLSKQLKADPYVNFTKIISFWRIKLQQISSETPNILNANSKKKQFFQFKRTVVQHCRRYFILLWRICTLSSQSKNAKQMQSLGEAIYQNLSQKKKLFRKQFNIIHQIQDLKNSITNMQKFFKLINSEYYGNIQIFNIQKKELQNYITQFSKYLGVLNIKIKKNLKKITTYEDEQINCSNIEQLFLIDYKLFQSLSNLEENVLKLNLSILKKLNIQKFSIPLFSIDKKLFAKQKSIDIKNQVFSIIDQQVKKIQKNQKNKSTQYNIHLVMEGFGKSHLYYANYLKLIQQSISAFKASKIVQNNIETNKNSIQSPKIQIKLAAITCSNFHSVFGFLYASGLNTQQLRRQMNIIQSIATVLQTNIDETFNQYKWTACSEMQIKMCFNQVWKDQFNAFNQLQKNSIKDINITKQIESLKSMYISNKDKILSFCQNSFDYLIDFVHKKIDKKTYLKRKLQISRGLGIDYLCENEVSHNFGHQNIQSSKQVQQLMRSMFNHYQSLIEYVLSQNQLILKNFNINQGNKNSLWKGIIIKKLSTTYKLKQYICNFLKQKKMNHNVTLCEFYEQTNKKILLTFTTIDNLNHKLQFMNKNTFPYMPVWAAILASTSLHFLYHQFQARKQWISKKFEVKSLFSKVIQDFFEKKTANNGAAKYGAAKYACGNFISTLPLQLLTNGKVFQQMFKLEQLNAVENNTNKKQISQHFIHIAIAFKSLRIKPEPYVKSLQKKYLNDLVCKFFCWKKNKMICDKIDSICRCITQYFCDKKRKLRLLNKISKLMNNQKIHDNNTYNVQRSSYIAQKISKILDFTVTGKVLNQLITSNDNLIMQLYRETVIKCPVKIKTLDFNKIVKNNKFQTKLFIPSIETLQTIDRSYYITKNFVKNTEQKANREVLVRIQLFTEERFNKSGLAFNNKIKCKMSFLSHSEWNKTIQQQFIVNYSLYQNVFETQKQQQVQNSQIVWDPMQNTDILLKFYYPQISKISGKQKKFIIQSNLFVSIAKLLEDFIQSLNLIKSPYSVSFDYKINYDSVKQKTHYQKAENMNRIKIQSQQIKLKSQLLVSTTFNNNYHKHKSPQIRYQFTKFIMEHTYTEEQAKQILKYSHPDKINKDKQVALVCRYCYQNLTLIANQIKGHNKCLICDKFYSKLECRNKVQNKQKTLRQYCKKSSYCLNCVKDYVLLRKKNEVICLFCTTKKLGGSQTHKAGDSSLLNTQAQTHIESVIPEQSNDNLHQKIQSQPPQRANKSGIDKSYFNINPKNHQKQQEQCYFCYQPYSKTKLFSCNKCLVKICNKCIGQDN